MSDLRTGAALVRALIAGDETARYALADWIEEHGVLPADHPHGEAFTRWALMLLRSDRTLRYEEHRPGEIWARCQREPGIHVVLLGTWPASVWE